MERLKEHREIAERHWNFIEGLLKSGTITDERTLGLIHYLYVEAWVHAIKHELGIVVPEVSEKGEGKT